MDRTIIKRNGDRQAYTPEKIITAMSKAFTDTRTPVEQMRLEQLLRRVEEHLSSRSQEWSVEEIQDVVERVLMEEGHYSEAKSYILYRNQRTHLRALRSQIAASALCPALEPVLADIQKDYGE